MEPVFAWPVRPRERFYVAAGYLDPAYRRAFGWPHTGEDWNLRTGGDSDLGYPVQAVFPGRVVAAAHYKVWGNLVVVEAEGWVREALEAALGRPLPGLWVRYGHLHHVTVLPGEDVNAGEAVGSIGKGDRNRFVAHLHIDFPVRLPRPEAYPGEDEEVRRDYLDPALVWKALKFADKPNLLPRGPLYAPAERIIAQDGEAPRGAVVNAVQGKLFVRPA